MGEAVVRKGTLHRAARRQAGSIALQVGGQHPRAGAGRRDKMA